MTAAAPPPTPPRDPRAERIARDRSIIAPLCTRFADGAIAGEITHAGQLFLSIAPKSIVPVLRFLKDDPGLHFELLVDLTCADFLKLEELAPKRFGLLYILYSFKVDVYARLRVYIDADDPPVATAATVFPGANWAEREVFDLYGIAFDGHPDPRRILLPDYYEGHPLRKDYPLKGRGERDRFPVVSRRES